MTQRIAIVAGGGGGVGQATAAALHSAGLTVVALDREEAALKQLDPGIHREVADATDPAVPKPVVERIAAEIGSPDVLVNTIGAYELGGALTVTPEILNRMVEVNLGPALWLTQAVAPYMQAKRSGVIVHVAARNGVDPMAGVAAYGVTKAALAHLTRILAVELRPHGIRVNSVLPEIIATAKNKAMLPPEMLASAVSPEAIAAMITFLVSEESLPMSGALVPAYGA